MCTFRNLLFVMGCVAVLLTQASADQQPGKDKQKDTGKDSFVARMMAFDKNKDGKLTKDEITDPRLLRLFDQIDKNKDGVVTKEELEAFAKEFEDGGRGPGPRGPGDRGPGDKGPGDRGPGDRGPGGRGPGGPPQPGQILPSFVQEMLKLTDDQKKQLDALQKEIDGKLGKILTEDQKKQLKEMRERGPRGPGGPGDRGPGDRGPGRPGEGGRPMPPREER